MGDATVLELPACSSVARGRPYTCGKCRRRVGTSAKLWAVVASLRNTSPPHKHTTRNTQHTTHNTQHTTHNTQHTTHNTQTGATSTAAAAAAPSDRCLMESASPAKRHVRRCVQRGWQLRNMLQSLQLQRREVVKVFRWHGGCSVNWDERTLHWGYRSRGAR